VGKNLTKTPCRGIFTNPLQFSLNRRRAPRVDDEGFDVAAGVEDGEDLLVFAAAAMRRPDHRLAAPDDDSLNRKHLNQLHKVYLRSPTHISEFVLFGMNLSYDKTKIDTIFVCHVMQHLDYMSECVNTPFIVLICPSHPTLGWKPA
jgi:hypothetical protein